MIEHPMAFSGPMVRALLDGKKTQTRRIIKPQGGSRVWQKMEPNGSFYWWTDVRHRFGPATMVSTHRVGDHLWVREAWRTEARFDDLPARDIPVGGLVSYDADYDREPNDGCRGRYRHARFMPRRISRLTLAVTDVRVQRLQDISEADAAAEGIECDSDGWRDYLMPATQCCNSAAARYSTLWDRLHGPGAWGANPWVAAYTFSVERTGIDRPTERGGIGSSRPRGTREDLVTDDHNGDP